MSDQPGPKRPLQFLRDGQLTRRQLLKHAAVAALAVPAASTLLSACSEDLDDGADADDEEDSEDAAADADEDTEEDAAETAEEEEPEETQEEEETEEDEQTADDERYGGTLNVATIGEPPTLDVHTTTAVTANFNGWQMFEALFTWDENLELMPELAESFDVQDDGLLVTVNLREDVNFHNGEVMTSEDVLASIERWSGIASLADGLMEATDEIELVDDLTMTFHMNEPFGPFGTMLARQLQGCTIHPKSVIDESDDQSLAEWIGTGPYMFVEHIPDRHIHYERFDDYTDRPDPPSGYGGSKARYLDEIFFYPVPDEAARISGLQSGEYHYLETIAPDHFDSLENDDRVIVELLPPPNWSTLVVNTAEGIMADQTMRQAFQAALNHEDMALAGYGEGFFRLDPGIMMEETAWHSTVGEELYNQADPDRAAELLEEAGYDGEPIVMMGTEEYTEFYNNAVVAQQQLEDAGFTVDLQVIDWATLNERRADPAEWDIFTTWISFRIDPVQQAWISGTTWPGWWDSDPKLEVVQRLNQEVEFEDRFAAFEELQQLFYEEVPMIKVADKREVNARSPQIQNFQPLVQLTAFFHNVWLEE